MKWRKMMSEEAAVLAPMNARLIEDEGHRNAMAVPDLADRMRSWLGSDYEAVVFEDRDVVVGYALFRSDGDSIFLRQFFIERNQRRRGVGRSAIEVLAREVWPAGSRITLDVLVNNAGAKAFWRAVGFVEYATTMERLPNVEWK